MPVLVVDVLEVVDVDHRQHQRQAVAGAEMQARRQLLVEVHAVAEAGERIPPAGFGEFRVRQPEPGVQSPQRHRPGHEADEPQQDRRGRPPEPARIEAGVEAHGQPAVEDRLALLRAQRVDEPAEDLAEQRLVVAGGDGGPGERPRPARDFQVDDAVVLQGMPDARHVAEHPVQLPGLHPLEAFAIAVDFDQSDPGVLRTQGIDRGEAAHDPQGLVEHLHEVGDVVHVAAGDDDAGNLDVRLGEVEPGLPLRRARRHRQKIALPSLRLRHRLRPRRRRHQPELDAGPRRQQGHHIRTDADMAPGRVDALQGWPSGIDAQAQGALGLKVGALSRCQDESRRHRAHAGRQQYQEEGRASHRPSVQKGSLPRHRPDALRPAGLPWQAYRPSR